jgi:FKBP-type peptidyl-prolyl cis-trans isomerase 2
MIKEGSKVKAHYTGRLTNNEVFDTSLMDGREPLEFTVGEGNLIQGFESGIMGLNTGDKKTIEILPEEAYGQYRDDMVMVVPKTNTPEGVQEGQTLQANINGEIFPFMVRQVNENDVVLDANHPLAGQTLIFEVEILEVA